MSKRKWPDKRYIEFPIIFEPKTEPLGSLFCEDKFVMLRLDRARKVVEFRGNPEGKEIHITNLEVLIRNVLNCMLEYEYGEIKHRWW